MATDTPTVPHLPHDEVIAILDFGSQTAQLIARRVREAGAFSLLMAPDVPASRLAALKPKGIILSGGPASVYEPGAPRCDPGIFSLGIPVLGICYGMQLACQIMGATIQRVDRREFGRANLSIRDRSGLFHAIPERTAVWMNHGDQVVFETGGGAGRPGAASLGSLGIEVLASTDTCPVAAVRVTKGADRFYGVQFHPEVTHTPHGVNILQNFLYEVCKCSGSWRMADFLQTAVERARK